MRLSLVLPKYLGYMWVTLDLNFIRIGLIYMIILYLVMHVIIIYLAWILHVHSLCYTIMMSPTAYMIPS